MDGISNTVHPWCPPSYHFAARRSGAELWPPSLACSLAVLRLAAAMLARAPGVACVIAGGDRRGQPNRAMGALGAAGRPAWQAWRRRNS